MLAVRTSRAGDVSPERIARDPIASMLRSPAGGSGNHSTLRRRGKTWLQPGRRPENTHPGLRWPQATSSSMTRLPKPATAHTHQWYDGTQHPWSSSGVASEPSLTILTRFTPRRRRRLVPVNRWRKELARTPWTARPWHRPKWQRARRHVLHTIILDPATRSASGSQSRRRAPSARRRRQNLEAD